MKPLKYKAERDFGECNTYSHEGGVVEYPERSCECIPPQGA